MGAAGSGRTHKVHQIITGPVRGTGSGWTGGGRHRKAPLGPSPGAGRDLTRGPHGLLPPRRDPCPATLSRVGRLRPSLTPSRTSGPLGQGPERTNLGPGKARAAVRIQNPSGTPP
jgi:hypothetical protein